MSGRSLSSAAQRAAAASGLRRARSSRSAGLRAASLRSMHSGLGDDERGSGSSRMRRNSIKSNASKASSVAIDDLVDEIVDDDDGAQANSEQPTRAQQSSARRQFQVPTTRSAMPRAPSMIPKRRRKGSVAMEEVALGRTLLHTLAETHDVEEVSDDSDVDSDEAGDGFAPMAPPKARPRRSSGVHTTQAAVKALPRSTSMMPKRKRKGSVAMEDVSMGRSLLHAVAEGNIFAEATDDDSSGADSADSDERKDAFNSAPPPRRRGRRSSGVHVDVAPAKALPRSTSMVPKRKRKGSVAMEEVALGRSLLHSVDEADALVESDDTGSSDSDDGDAAAQPSGGPLVPSRPPGGAPGPRVRAHMANSNASSLPRSTSMVPKRRRKGSVAMEDVNVGRTLLHSVAENDMAEEGSDGSESEEGNTPGAQNGRGSAPRRKSGVHTTLAPAQALPRSTSMMPKRKRKGSVAVDEIALGRSLLHSVAEGGSFAEGEEDEDSDSLEGGDAFPQGSPLSPKFMPSSGSRPTGAPLNLARVQPPVSRGGALPRAPSLMPKRKRKGSVAMEEVNLGRALLHKVSEGSFGSLGSLDAEFLASTDSLTSPRHLNEVSPPAATRYGRGGNFGGSRPAPGGVHQKVAGGGSLPRAPSLMPKRKRRGSAAMDAIPPRRAILGSVMEKGESFYDQSQRNRRPAPVNVQLSELASTEPLRSPFRNMNGPASLGSPSMVRQPSVLPRRKRKGSVSVEDIPKTRTSLLGPVVERNEPERSSRTLPPAIAPSAEASAAIGRRLFAASHGAALPSRPVAGRNAEQSPSSNRRRRRASGVHSTAAVDVDALRPKQLVAKKSFMPRRARKGSVAPDEIPGLRSSLLHDIVDRGESSRSLNSESWSFRSSQGRSPPSAVASIPLAGSAPKSARSGRSLTQRKSRRQMLDEIASDTDLRNSSRSLSSPRTSGRGRPLNGSPTPPLRPSSARGDGSFRSESSRARGQLKLPPRHHGTMGGRGGLSRLFNSPSPTPRPRDASLNATAPMSSSRVASLRGGVATARPRSAQAGLRGLDSARDESLRRPRRRSTGTGAGFLPQVSPPAMPVGTHNRHRALPPFGGLPSARRPPSAGSSRRQVVRR